MRHLRKYNESSESVNNDYIEIIDILQYVFDDFNVRKLPKEAEEDPNEFLTANERIPYWTFITRGKGDFDIDTSIVPEGVEYSFTNNPDKYILMGISLLNIESDIGKELIKSIKSEKERIEENIKKELILTHESFSTSSSITDICIRFSDIIDEFGKVNPSYENFRYLSDEDKKKALDLYKQLEEILKK